MIFPRECKEIGFATTRPCGDQVYFLSRYLVHQTAGGYEVMEVKLGQEPGTMMRAVEECSVIARSDEVYWYPEKVQINDRARLAQMALESGFRCTIFTGLDEHITFVLDPDPSAFQTVYVYDVTPPRPSLSAAIRDMEAIGMFGDLDVSFQHTLRDISQIDAEVYPCRASGFLRTVDADLLLGGESVAGCLTASQILKECYEEPFQLHDICPLNMVAEEPFIARCCRNERGGFTEWNGKRGVIVHWGASPSAIYSAISGMLAKWRERDEDRGC
ncbi:hypothetical protein J2741_001008 [Methanolinea mesophila]|uniref:DUF7714 family protein n=1 Tax=Methanolinea mesophila TaxID=547055 RepID=UPI001AE8A407|nr:hypothetical protein [Methanolinea mesophila]MBP1928461.1 hypothetical protein [Methanolinea mesophila]